jgi:hypothetical protein
MALRDFADLPEEYTHGVLSDEVGHIELYHYLACGFVTAGGPGGGGEGGYRQQPRQRGRRTHMRQLDTHTPTAPGFIPDLLSNMDAADAGTHTRSHTQHVPSERVVAPNARQRALLLLRLRLRGRGGGDGSVGGGSRPRSSSYLVAQI